MKSSGYRRLLAIASLLVATTPFMVQAQEKPDFPIDDQAKHLQNFQSPSVEQWSFSENNSQELSNYSQSLSISVEEVRLVEQKPPEWRNTGDDANYSVLVDVYDFTPEEF